MVPLFSFVRALQRNLLTAERRREEKSKKNEHVFLTNCWLKTLLCSRLLPGEVHPPFCQPFGCWFCPAFSKRNIETIWNQPWPGASYGLSECETLDSDPDLPRSNLIIWHLQKKKRSSIWDMSRDVLQFANSMIGVTKTDILSARNRPSLKKPMRSKPNLRRKAGALSSHLSRWLSCKLQTKFDASFMECHDWMIYVMTLAAFALAQKKNTSRKVLRCQLQLAQSASLASSNF